jgi:hypothetical protein
MARPPEASEIESIPSLWAALRDHLQERFRELSLEIRHYPTPIARCDDQLPKLIEQRDHARTELERMRSTDEGSSGPSAPSMQALERFVDAALPSDDDVELAIRSRLAAAILASKG